MTKNLVKTLIGLGIGVFFVWLSASDWPLDQIIGPVSLTDGHLVVGAGFVPADAAEEAALLHVDGWAVDLLWLIPYLAIAAVVSYNNDTERLPSASLAGGAGLRVGPFSRATGSEDPRPFFGRLYVFAEVLANWVFFQHRAKSAYHQQRTFSLPVLLGVGMEIWP